MSAVDIKKKTEIEKKRAEFHQSLDGGEAEAIRKAWGALRGAGGVDQKTAGAINPLVSLYGSKRDSDAIEKLDALDKIREILANSPAPEPKQSGAKPKSKPTDTPVQEQRGVLSLGNIRTDGGTQVRQAMNAGKVAEYTNLLNEGGSFDRPPVVFHDGTYYWLADGFHRVEAYSRHGATEIEFVIREGTQRDARLYNIEANTRHGLPMTNEDKRRAVRIMAVDEECREYVDAEIARRCGVSAPFVAKIRKQLESGTQNGLESSPGERVRKTKDGRKIKTGNIGRKKKSQANKPPKAQHAEDPSPALQAPPVTASTPGEAVPSSDTKPFIVEPADVVLPAVSAEPEPTPLAESQSAPEVPPGALPVVEDVPVEAVQVEETVPGFAPVADLIEESERLCKLVDEVVSLSSNWPDICARHHKQLAQTIVALHRECKAAVETARQAG